MGISYTQDLTASPALVMQLRISSERVDIMLDSGSSYNVMNINTVQKF